MEKVEQSKLIERTLEHQAQNKNENRVSLVSKESQNKTISRDHLIAERTDFNSDYFQDKIELEKFCE